MAWWQWQVGTRVLCQGSGSVQELLWEAVLSTRCSRGARAEFWGATGDF